MKFNKVMSIALCTAMIAGAFSVTASADETWKIGGIGPITGGAAVYGTAAMNGAQIAVDEINAAGGINGVQVELNFQDDEHDAEKSVNAYNTLKDWGMQMCIGCVTTTPCIAVSVESANDNLLMLTPSASSTKVLDAGDTVFQLCFTDPAQGSASATYISENLTDITKVGVIYKNDDEYSKGIYATFRAQAEELGFEIVAEQTFTEDSQTDFSVQVAECKNAGAELVFLPIYYTPASLILAAAADAEYSPIWFGVDGMDGILDLEGFDTSLAEGVMLLTPFAADATDELTQNFVAAYEEAYGTTPIQFAADGYDCAYALKAAIESTDLTPDASASDVCDALKVALTEIEVTGVTGTMTWSADGTVSKTPKAVVIEDGAYKAFEG